MKFIQNLLANDPSVLGCYIACAGFAGLCLYIFFG